MTGKQTQQLTDRLFEAMAAILDIRQAPDCPAITAPAVRIALQQALAETLGTPCIMIVWGKDDGSLEVNIGVVK